MKFSSFLVSAALVAAGSVHCDSVDLDRGILEGKWDLVAQSAHHFISSSAQDPAVRLKGATALFQKGYPNAALLMLEPLSSEQWKTLQRTLPQLVERVMLYQKKIPLNVLTARLENLETSTLSPLVRDEAYYSQGRVFFEAGNFSTARSLLEKVSSGSRYYGAAWFLLGATAAKEKRYREAKDAFSKILASETLSQASEFWTDVLPEDGASAEGNLRVQFDPSSLSSVTTVGEISRMAMARVAYAQGEFGSAIREYDQIQRQSPFFGRSRLEKIWALLATNEHEKAAGAALDLARETTVFESISARPVRALILTDAGKIAEAREELENFYRDFENFRRQIAEYRRRPDARNLPPFLASDLKQDLRLRALAEFQEQLKREIQRLRQEDGRLYPVYGYYSNRLGRLVSQSQNLISSFTEAQIRRRFTGFDSLFVQAKLISAETYLEEREQLRSRFAKRGAADPATEAQLLGHDREVVGLLTKAVAQVDEATHKISSRHLPLEFRQSELLWELASAADILHQVDSQNADPELAKRARARALEIVTDLADSHPEFSRHAQALFLKGFILIETNRIPPGIQTMNAFLKAYPNHEQAPNALRILGDMEFDSSRFSAARDIYRKILQFSQSPIVGYALYKMGWCEYHLKNPSGALVHLEQAIVWAKNSENTDHLINLRREARRDLISIFAESGSHRKALEYFERFAAEESSGWLAELAARYEQTGQYEKSTELYGKLLQMNPSTEEHIRYRSSMVKGSYFLQDWASAFENQRELIRQFESVLQPVQKPESAAALAEKVLRETLLAQQFEFKGNATPKDLSRVREMDSLYIEAFRDWPESQLPWYQHGIFLMKYSDYHEAAKVLREFWERFRSTLKEPEKEEALQNLVHCLEKNEETGRTEIHRVSEANEAIVKYSSEYVSTYPKTESFRPIAFLKAVTLFKMGRTEEGIQASQALLDTGVNDSFSEKAFQNIKVALYGLKDWKRASDWANDLSKKPYSKSAKYFKDLQKIRGETLFLIAEQTPDALQAAEVYQGISQDSDLTDLHAESLHNAFLKYQGLNRREDALRVSALLEKSHPTFGPLEAIAPVRAAYYQEAGDFARAEPLYGRFLEKPPAGTDPKVVQEIRLNDGLILEALGKKAKAEAVLRPLLSASVPPELSNEAKLALERLQDSAKRGPASVKEPVRWSELVGRGKAFQAKAISDSGELAVRIHAGAKRLEALAKEFLSVSSASDVDTFFALESYCTVPFLYEAYHAGVLGLGKGESEELVTELAKVASPVAIQVEKLSSDCLEKSQAAFHDGPVYRAVLSKWGWAKSSDLQLVFNQAMSEIAREMPWVDDSTDAKGDESQWISQHLLQKGNMDSWFSLGKIRFDQARLGESRLSWMMGLGAKGDATNRSRLLNGLAVLEQQASGAQSTAQSRRRFASLFSEALEAGSGAAGVNLALVNLSAGRLKDALVALDRPVTRDVLGRHSGIEAKVDALQRAAKAGLQ